MPLPSPGSAGEGGRRSGRPDEGVRAAAPTPAAELPPTQASSSPPQSDAPLSVPCATSNLETTEVWTAILNAASEKNSLYTLVSSLHLVSLTPERAVVGHSPRDRMTAEMALGHLSQLFERILGRRVAVSIMQVKDAPPSVAAPVQPESRSSAPVSVPAPPRPQTHPSPAFTPQRSAPTQQAAVPATPSAQPSRALSATEIDAAKAHPLVVRAGELLNAKVVRINARTDSSKPTQPPTP